MAITSPTVNAIPPRRPFRQFHLSTVVLLVLIAGTMMYVHLAPPATPSDISSAWTTTNGLSMRISMDPSVISIHEQRAVIAEFRNDSNATIVIEKENGLGASRSRTRGEGCQPLGSRPHKAGREGPGMRGRHRWEKLHVLPTAARAVSAR